MLQVSIQDPGHVHHDDHLFSREGVASGQADPAVGVGSQVLPVLLEDCGSESGESGGLVGGRQVHYKT